MEMHPSHKVVHLPRLEGEYVCCDREDCGADAIIDGDKPCPVPVRPSPILNSRLIEAAARNYLDGGA
jgi:hypothetical protein